MQEVIFYLSLPTSLNLLNADTPKYITRVHSTSAAHLIQVRRSRTADKAHGLAVPVPREVEGQAAGQPEMKIGEANEIVAEVRRYRILRLKQVRVNKCE